MGMQVDKGPSSVPGFSLQEQRKAGIYAFKQRVSLQRKSMVPSMLFSWGMLIGGVVMLSHTSPFSLQSLISQPSLFAAMPWAGFLAVALIVVGTVGGVASAAAFASSDSKEVALDKQIDSLSATHPLKADELDEATFEEDEVSYAEDSDVEDDATEAEDDATEAWRVHQ